MRKRSVFFVAPPPKMTNMMMMTDDPVDLGDDDTITTTTVHPTTGPFLVDRFFSPDLIGACMHQVQGFCQCAMHNETKRFIKIHISPACGETDEQAMQRLSRVFMCIVRGDRRTEFPTHVMRNDLMQTEEYRNHNVFAIPLHSVALTRFHEFEMLDHHSMLRLQLEISKKKPCECFNLLRNSIDVRIPSVLLEIILSYMAQHSSDVSIGMCVTPQ